MSRLEPLVAGRPDPCLAPRVASFGWRAAGIVTAIVAIAGAAHAGPPAHGIFMTWHDCRMGAGAEALSAFSCDSNQGQHELVAGFRLSQAVDSVIAIEMVIDVQLADAIIVPWWEFQANGCRQSLLQASADVTMTSCADPWSGNGLALVQDYQIGAPRSGANQARMRVVVAVSPSDSARTLLPDTDYAAARVILRHEKSTGLGSCSGCAIEACLVLNSMWLRVLPGGAEDVYLEIPAGANAQMAGWQGTSADCQAVPVRRQTWGQIKQLYR